MLVGQQLGPFKIEKELGTGAMGAVYRGVYSKTGQKVAIKIMAPSLASDPRALARFEREANILKQLKHPNIVRYFGIGKHQGMRFYAMEYVEGESLDRVMARRGRMTWEEVATLGQQLCSALQHAHQAGIIHRDLKPSNLMVLPDGTLKLTDFGIAKDMDVTQLTEANCTVGTAAYMSPEQCKGERDLTHKSDLYSLGIVFYELLTGKKPFTAENAMDMFMKHVQGKFERPSRVVLDVPVWLDNLVCQMLEKRPDQRPFDADMVGNVLATIQEKVEAQQSAGVDAARARRADRPRNQPPADDTDREAARTLLGKPKPKGKKKKKGRFYEAIWFQVAGLVVLLLGMVGTLLFLFHGTSSSSADKLFAQAQKLMASKDPEDWEKAHDGPIKKFLDAHAVPTDPHTPQMKDWNVAFEIYRNEQLLRRYLQKKNSPLKVQSQSDAEQDGFKAIDAEEEGDLQKAKELWQGMEKKYEAGSGYTRWGQLAREHLKGLERIEAEEKILRTKYDIVRRGGDPALNSDQEAESFLAYRYEQFGDLHRARKHYQKLKEKYADQPELRDWFLLVASRERKITEELDNNPDKGKDLVSRLKEKLAEANDSKTERDQAKGICKNIIDLYKGAKDKDLEELVKEAQTRWAQLQ